jgi:hypothetical protein
LSPEKITPILISIILLLFLSHCKKEDRRIGKASLNDEAFTFLMQEKALPVENEIAFEGNLPCGHCAMISIYLHFDLERFYYKRRQKFYINENDYTTRIDSGALSFIQGNDVDPHALIYGLEADTSNIQYFLMVNETEIELLDAQLNPLHLTPPPILHKQAVRHISHKE